MKIFFTPECLLYHYPGHPESPERIRTTQEYLEREGYAFSEPQPCTEADALRVHTQTHITGIKTETFFDGDTPPIPQIYRFALLSAGAAILASEAAAGGETAFSIMRPPGHHATQNRVMGFCYLNNIAIAAARYLEDKPDKKVAILDIDCHHGNGTEAIFLGNPAVLYVSLHQSPLYPGTGLVSRENAINFPLPPNTGESEYLKALEEACQKIADFSPALLGISAGFDTFREDPLTLLDLETKTYRKIGKIIAGLEKPTFIVMEGGYSQKLPQCVFQFIQNWNR